MVVLDNVTDAKGRAIVALGVLVDLAEIPAQAWLEQVPQTDLVVVHVVVSVRARVPEIVLVHAAVSVTQTVG